MLAKVLENPRPGDPAPVTTRATGHVTISVRFARVRIDDDIRPLSGGNAATITVRSATEYYTSGRFDVDLAP